MGAGVALRLFDTGLKTIGYRRVCHILLRLSPPSTLARIDLFRAQAVAAIVNKIAQDSPRPMNCVRRSMVLWWMLRWLGLNSELKIGLNREKGHAWVEHAGRVINDSADVASQYAVLYEDELNPEVVGRIVRLG
jgi:hypothetical protein